MSKHTPSYRPEFCAEAIRLARTSGKRDAEIARELAMTGEILWLWFKQGVVLLDALRPLVTGSPLYPALD